MLRVLPCENTGTRLTLYRLHALRVIRDGVSWDSLMGKRLFFERGKELEIGRNLP